MNMQFLITFHYNSFLSLKFVELKHCASSVVLSILFVYPYMLVGIRKKSSISMVNWFDARTSSLQLTMKWCCIEKALILGGYNKGSY